MTIPSFVSITPNLKSRVALNSSFVIVYDRDLAGVTTQNIIFEDASNTPISFSLGTPSSATDIIINPDSDLKLDTVFSITLTTGITDAASGNDPIVAKKFNFVTIEKSQTPVINLTKDGNVNDIFFEQRRFIELFNIREILDTGSKFNYSYTPTFFDPISKTYSTNQPDQVKFDIEDIVKTKFKKQFLFTFQDYLTNIKGFNTVTAAEFLDVEKTVLTKASQLNQETGLKNLIKFIIELQANAQDKFFVEVISDPILPFKYHIATDLPREQWLKTIKPLVHPIGWVENFLQIPLQSVQVGCYTVDYKTDTFTLANHGLLDGQLHHHTTDNKLPSPLKLNTNHFIVNATTNTFKVSLTLGGPPIDITDNGTGTNCINILQYFQTEQYQWTDKFLLTTTPVDNSIGQYGFRRGFYIKGQNIAFIVPKITSLDPPIVDPSFSISSDYTITNVSNWAHPTTILETGADGRVSTKGTILTTDIDLSGRTAGELNGKLLFIFDGPNLGFFTIASHTISSSANVITINETFTIDERDIKFEIHNTSTEDEQSKLLAVLNSLQFKHRFVFSYLQSNAFGELSNVSRLTFDEFGTLQLFFVPNSTVKTFTGGDTIFFYDDENNPILWVQSTNFQTVNFTFGNIILFNQVTEISLATTSGIFLITSFSAPDSATGFQTITFDSSEDISKFEITDKLIISDANALNNGTQFIEKVNLPANSVEVNNAAGIAETPSDASAVHSVPTHHFVVTFILPDTFSFDFQLFNGFAIYFDKNKIHPLDLFSECLWNYSYAKYLGNVQYPDDADSDFSDIQNDIATSPFQTKTELGTFKVYNEPSGGFEIKWNQNHLIWEYTADSSGEPVNNNGTLFGRIAKFDSANNKLIVHLFSATDFTDNKYYSNVDTIGGPFIVSGEADQADLGSSFIDTVTQYERKIRLGFNIPDFDSYTWNLDIPSDTIVQGNQFIFFGESSLTYTVDLDVQETGSLSSSAAWSAPENFAPSEWVGL